MSTHFIGWSVGIGIGVGVLLICILMQRVFAGYRRAFLGRMSAQFKDNFVLTDPATLFAASMLAAVVLGALGYVWAGPVGAVVGTVAAIVAPRLWAARMVKARRKQFIYQLPDAIIALGSALRAGASLNKGLEQLATRQPAPLRQEFGVVFAEYNVGRALEESLTDMRTRIGAPELDLMNTAINVSRRVGGNLADTLESLARTLQEKAQVEGKLDSLTAMGKGQAWVACIIPLLLTSALFKIEPERMHPLFTDPVGWGVLALAAVLFTCAVFWIRSIVNIDI